MLGLILAVFSGLTHCTSSILVRKGVVHTGESFTPIPISNFIGFFLFGIAILIHGDFARLPELPLLGFVYLAGAGLLHFILGRSLVYTGVRLIGANRSNPLGTTNILISAIFGILFLGEPLTINLAVALPLIFIGVIMISRSNSGKSGPPITKAMLTRGMMASLAGAVCWGISPVLIKLGLQQLNLPVLGTFVSYAAAAAFAALTLIAPANSQKMRKLDRTALVPLATGGVTTSLAHLLRYVALSFSPVSLVAPVVASLNALAVFPMSYLMNRKLETFDSRIMLGAGLIITGVLLLFLAA